MTIPSSRSLILWISVFSITSSSADFGRLRQTSDVFGRLRASSGIFGNDRVVLKNPSTLRIKISRLHLRKSWQVYSLRTWLKRAYTFIDPSMLSSSSIVQVQGCLAPQNNILQITDVTLQFVFLLFLPCFQLLFHLVLTFETSEMSAIFVFITKTILPHPQVFSVNGALTYQKAAHFTSSVH